MFISEIENDALNQAKLKLNEIKINGNHAIFEVPVIHTGLSPRFLCHPTAFYSTCWNRGTSERSSIRKTADLPLQLWVDTFLRFVAIGLYFLSETLI